MDKNTVNIENEIDLQKANGVDLGRITHSRFSCANITDFIGSEMKKVIVDMLKEKKGKFLLLWMKVKLKVKNLQ